MRKQSVSAAVLSDSRAVAYLPTATNPRVKQEKRYQRYPASVVDARLKFIGKAGGRGMKLNNSRTFGCFT